MGPLDRARRGVCLRGLLIVLAAACAAAVPLGSENLRAATGHAAVPLSERLRRGEHPSKLQVLAPARTHTRTRTQWTCIHCCAALSQDASKVLLGNLTSYAGFFTVDAEKASNMFFWFFPSLNGDEKAPLLIWLQGGPGASSMFSLFHEIGPYELSRNGGKHGEIHLGQRERSWNNRYSLLFIDNPVGAGFSFTGAADGYAKTEEEVAAHLLVLLSQFYLVFPAKAKVPLYLTGESYAGHYLPAFGNAIHQHNAALEPSSPTYIPLVGLAIGDGWIDPVRMPVSGLGVRGQE